ncbi:hypothetical protein SSX86_030513 [Deinandra increscens subsp. villosa]|uniref:PAZ domain-containing protein n=1 Tax=Deinandra increscens subsp. villosa TaxID=3103831 RepID=A0AAP0GJ57_9ASTR
MGRIGSRFQLRSTTIRLGYPEVFLIRSRSSLIYLTPKTPRLHAKGVIWMHQGDDSFSSRTVVVLRLSHGGDVDTDGNCLFTASQKALNLKEISARDLRRRTVRRFLEDLRSETAVETTHDLRLDLVALVVVVVVVSKYYARYRNLELNMSHDYPCLDAGKPKRPVYIPLELCELISLQRYTKALSNLQRASLVEKSRQKPQDRMQSLMGAKLKCCVSFGTVRYLPHPSSRKQLRCGTLVSEDSSGSV